MDGPDIIVRIFKIKLDSLLHDLKHGKYFGKVIVGIKYNPLLFDCCLVFKWSNLFNFIMLFFLCVNTINYKFEWQKKGSPMLAYLCTYT